MKKTAKGSLIILFLAMMGVNAPAEEHGGKGVQEHGGKAAKTFNATEIKSALRKHIAETADAKGIMRVHDDQMEKDLALKFIKIHDPVRVMKKKGQYFACTDFHIAGQEKKIYDIDFWLEPAEGQLRVVETKVHKHPVKKKTKWIKHPRYTFKDEDIVAIP